MWLHTIGRMWGHNLSSTNVGSWKYTVLLHFRNVLYCCCHCPVQSLTSAGGSLLTLLLRSSTPSPAPSPAPGVSVSVAASWSEKDQPLLVLISLHIAASFIWNKSQPHHLIFLSAVSAAAWPSRVDTGAGAASSTDTVTSGLDTGAATLVTLARL